MADNSALDLIETYVSSGTAVLLLGPNFSFGSEAMVGGCIPSFFSFPSECCAKFDLDVKDFSSNQEIIDYLTSNPERERQLREFMRQRYTVTRPHNRISALFTVVWRKIYSFDISDAIDVSYRKNFHKKQKIVVVRPNDPLPRRETSGQTLEIVKLYGDALSDSFHSYFTIPSFREFVATSRRYRALRVDFELRPVIVLGEENDRDFLFTELRGLRRTESLQRIVFVAPNLKPRQQTLLEEQGGIYLDLDRQDFLSALSTAFPTGRSLDDISTTVSGFNPQNKDLRDILTESFTVLTSQRLEELASHTSMEGGIQSFYRGDHVRWSDISRGIHADLTPFRNWRNRISLELEKGFPFGKMFLLSSPAGMGKTVGLMSTVYWLRQRTKCPILWLDAHGDLKGFLMRIGDNDFRDGVFVVVDDIMNFIDAFEGVPRDRLTKVAFLCTSRETRLNRYRRRLPESLAVSPEPLRKLNKSDAEELHSKIEKYGTTVHFATKETTSQIQEILDRSRKDMLILIREIGQGRKFDEIVRSEIAELTKRERASYLMVCITDRNQVPLPINLFSHALQLKFPDAGVSNLLSGLGRILETGGRNSTLRTRHSMIAQHVVEQRNSIVDEREVEEAVRDLLNALSDFQIPILVHHSNTGIARVFKSIINQRFLSETLKFSRALQIYRDFEKVFEKDGFFWQQYGLCQSKAGDYELALETLRHAFAIHDHFQIRHSLGAISLTACAKLGPEGLRRNEFHELRSSGQELLSELHKEFGHRDDLPISSLAELDSEISKKFDGREEFQICCEKYHRLLAFYIRDYPEMENAQRSYSKLNDLLSRASVLDDPDYDGLSGIYL